MIENGRKSDFRPAKKNTTSSFDVPTYRDFVILLFFHGGIRGKIRTALHGTRRSELVILYVHPGKWLQSGRPSTLVGVIPCSSRNTALLRGRKKMW